MSDMALLFESLRLMLIGMGIVFSFLLLLVGLLRLMSWVAARLAPLPQIEPVAAAAMSPSDAPPIAAITAAVARYRADKGR